MNDPLGVSPSKGNQGTTRGKEKILLTSVGVEPMTSGLDLPLTLPTEIEGSDRESGGRGFDSQRGQNIFFFTSCDSLIPFARANAQWVIHGFN